MLEERGFVISFALAHTNDQIDGHHMMGLNFSSNWGLANTIFVSIFWILLIIALILLIIWLIKQIQK